MSDKKKPVQDDIALFRDTVKGTTPLQHDKVEPHRQRPAPIPKKTRQDEEQVLQEMLSDDFDPVDMDTGDAMHFQRSGLQHGLMRKLRRGQYSISAELDLHGMTAAEARLALLDFLKSCQEKQARHVRIIHGKGLGSPNRQAVLKTKINSWLRQIDDVLAFCSARPEDGGTGAVYVLLKRRQ